MRLLVAIRQKRTPSANHYRRNAMIFHGETYSRSSVGKEPSVARAGKISDLNPKHTYRIIGATGWATVLPGTVNLAVQEEGAPRRPQNMGELLVLRAARGHRASKRQDC